MIQTVDYGTGEGADVDLASPQKSKPRTASDGEFDEKETEHDDTELTEEESDFESKRPTVKGKPYRARAKAQ
jgi:hypothetical protein